MKHEKISIKWKIFLYLLAFTAILLTVLWLIQVCYLDTFYKMIKTKEAERLTSQIINVMQDENGLGNISQQIDALAALHNMSVFVADVQGNAVYSAEYIATSRLKTMSAELILLYYRQAKMEGGTTKIEFEGGRNMTMPDEEMQQTDREDRYRDKQPENEGTAEGKYADDAFVPAMDGFMQNRGQDRIESVIYVNIIKIDGEEQVLMVNTQLTPVDATVNTLRIELICITVIMIGLSLAIALLISRKVSKSLIRISASANEMARGNFDICFEGRDYREVAELAETLNMTATELNKNELLRRELIANVSHDLRTPLTMIIAYAEVMRDLPGENTPENVQVIIDEAQRLTNLVNDMLDISKLQAGAMEKQTSCYNLTESIESVFARYNKLKEQDGYNIFFSYDCKVLVEADEYKIFQVIYNLINNAINYAGEDKRIWVRQEVRGGYVRIEVTDRGEGIAPEDIPYVWERYYKVDKTHRRAVMGTGLGLSIVKNILIQHDARYGVDSEAGKGSTFWFELKIAG